MFDHNPLYRFAGQANILVWPWPNFDIWAEVTLALAATYPHIDLGMQAVFPYRRFQHAQNCLFAVGQTVYVAAYVDTVLLFVHSRELYQT